MQELIPVVIWLALGAPPDGHVAAAQEPARPAGGVILAQSGPRQGRRGSRPRDEKLRARDLPPLYETAKAAVTKGEYQTAADVIDKVRHLFDGARSSARSEEVADWRLMDARVQLALRRHEAAGLAAMKIVILQPDSPRVAAALCLTAEAYEGMGRPSKAAELYESCLARKPPEAALRRRAEEGLARVRPMVPQQ